MGTSFESEVPVAFNVKNPAALASLEAAVRLTGEGKTQAVKTALEERLERLLRGRSQPATADERLARVMAIVRDSAPRFVAHGYGPDATGSYPDPTEALYDEHGLPA